ncbi:LOW QUALITY PROTEIN: CST complex subunit CTC1-like [Anoplopoma fimbria]|uniref:LOW QUALITY PROTEIN: CST complex subunit CTC1-like n=1 Tax=Anoplopoma fimbria TaxID=229290 RepID=UPI0023EC76D3|nr:LOW QUALITY PROTEIN: CST complex subunit CTC1-like [Anoplopoma fimbria]
MLCTCLRSSLRVTAFSRVGGSSPDSSCPGDGALPRLLLEKNMGVSEYLWTCHLSSQLTHSLVPSVLKQQCVCVLSWKLMEFVMRRRRRRGRREIYSEMLDEPHTCPLTQYSVDPYSVDPAVHQYISISELSQSLQSECWSSVSLSSLLPPGGSGLTRSQINTALAWSCRTLTSDLQERPQTGDRLRRRPLLLVGVLELPSLTSEQTLQLRDTTGAVACVATETSEEEEGGQRAAFNTAWIEGEESSDDVTARKQTAEEEETEGAQTAARKRRREADSSVTVTTGPRPCVSVVIRLEQKEGVSWRNMAARLKGEEAGLTLCFSVRAAVIGPVVSWGRDPKNGPMTDRETETESEYKVVLVFSGGSARWFPLLQPGCFYRLTAPNTQALSPTVLSVSDVLDCRSELVCFQAQVCDRISLNNRTSDSVAGVCAGVRLTVCDQIGRTVQVYLDLSHTPYPPGLLPGNTLLLSAFQRRVSRSGGVYCSSLPVSSLTVVSLGDSSSALPPPAPMMHLGAWSVSREQRCIVGQVTGHVVCFLFLQLQWSCSLCGSLYMQTCSSSPCGSTSSVFQSKAKLVIDDGTGEAHVWFSGALVRPLLGLADSQWEGLQRALRVRGHIRVYPRGRSMRLRGSAEENETS